MKRREITIPTILGILMSVLGMGAGIWFLREPIRSTVFASVEEEPSEVLISNITDTSFAVSWVTQKAASGYIQYGETDPNLVVSDDRDQSGGSVENYFTHLVTLQGLKPTTKYNFRIGSGGSKYDQEGQLYGVTTGLGLGSPPAADVAYGQVLAASGEPAEGALVYATLAGAVPQVALVNSGGAWVVPLSTVRSADLTSFAAYDLQASQINIRVAAGPMGAASVVTTTAEDSPVPVITLGQSYDYTSTAETTGEEDTGEETLSGGESKLSDLGPSTPSATLSILSPKPAEEVNSTQPEVIGRGPANTEVTITINSETAITDTVQTDANGKFSYTVPEGLTPGTHTITISGLVDGIIKTVTRSFVVKAAGESNVPAFTATPSATIKPSPTPKASPTAPPRVANPSTASGVPTSGSTSPTIILIVMGFMLMLSGAVVYQKLT
ncbi:MAG: fibronectin type III domain-containing protein [bacterium]|nr:fibronectin type III domain-containing protein [bacterium]